MEGGILIPSVYVYVLSCSVVSNSLRPQGLQHARFMGILQARTVEWVAMPFSRGIFPIQESNPGLPHRRWIFYHLSHQGSPFLQPGDDKSRKGWGRQAMSR